MTRLSFLERAKQCTNPTAKKLFELMASKKTNLAVSADCTLTADLLALANLVGPHICVLKTHIDIIADFTPQTTLKLQELAHRHQFLIFEDRKFADIGNTVLHQYKDSIYHIADWADIINAHLLPGPGIVEGLKQIGLPRERGLLLIAQMSSKDHLFTEQYTQHTVMLAQQQSDFVIGFICREKLTNDPRFIHMTPGVQFAEGSDALGQTYLTPTHVIQTKGSDIIIVGRGIYQAIDPADAAKKYRAAAWDALLSD